VHVVDLTARDTHRLRRTVLRDGTASDEVVFDGDELPTTFHLGVRDHGELIAISSWMERRHPDLPTLPAYQLRGMATDPARRGTGAGALLLTAGIERCRTRGAALVWARARVSALGFYTHHGFDTHGPEYIDSTTGLPHTDIWCRIPPVRSPGVPAD
jgi:predicted GNAT family N-acyltransferase